MLALKYREVTVEKGAICLELFLTRHFLLDVVRSVDQMVEDLLLDGLWVLLFGLLDDLL